MTMPLRSIDIPTLRRFRQGKVRDSFDLGDRLLMVASDRASAFDVILPDAIPDKGRVLTMLASWWFRQTDAIVPNHLLSTDVEDLPDEVQPVREVLRDRFMLVRKAERIDIECVVRGYLAGSGWAEYQKSGSVCGERLPKGLRESDKLPAPIFTPAAKVDDGHDQNISFAEVERRVGVDTARRLREASFALYTFAERKARERGILIADTKFEFGMIDRQLIVIDEMLTPDSSRFWDAALYEPGRAQDSLDKQPIRDWLQLSGWDKTPPGPPLPAEVIEATTRRYRTAFERLTGMEFPEA
ncbi:MAG TPA: phosphoribosylaminoimidazolesuccinocarboxamide synthase [Chloroflexi bacterium]|nr:phosphoribosylaminoimidazolesuccinocarboxamide synthase [Chloroflexota bacterium]HBY45964.1 phosphoribosylaminoimidazolesuccinocarboxamide synthase [Chloroflexota bacterium]HCG30692.1 phosphoribosylaminoimidazolesuccinocarboxamide synthase [Chloroflexota bacterium]